MNIGIYISPFPILRPESERGERGRHYGLGYDAKDYSENQACVIAPHTAVYRAGESAVTIIRGIARVDSRVPKEIVAYVTPMFSSILEPVANFFPAEVITWLYPIGNKDEMLARIKRFTGTDRNAAPALDETASRDLSQMIINFRFPSRHTVRDQRALSRR